MSEKTGLTCGIVQDLLPLYVDGLTSGETGAAVEAHLSSCESCSAMYQRMKAGEISGDSRDATKKDVSEKAIDYLKKIRRQTRFDVGLAVVVLLMFFLVLCYHVTFQQGQKMSIDEMDYTLSYEIYDGDDEATLWISGNFKDTARGFGHTEISDTDKGIDISFYSTPVTNRHTNTFSSGFSVSATQQVSIDGVVIWDGGTEISRKTAAIYQTKTDYIGDMSACHKVADALGIATQFGNYTNELTTSAQPYDWRLVLQYPLKTDMRETAETMMRADAAVLMAMIDNLDSVTWDYVTDEGQQVMTISAEDASAYAGMDVKSCGTSAAALQELLMGIGLETGSCYVETDPLGQVPYGFEIDLEVGNDLYASGFKLYMYLDDEMVFGQMYYNVSESAKNLQNGARILHDIVDTDDFGGRISDEGLSRLTFDLSVYDEEGQEYKVAEKQNLAAVYGESYAYVLSGSYEEGFVLTEK